MKVRIEKNVPIPTAKKPKTGLSDQVLNMDIGDSFIVPVDKSTQTAIYNAIRYVTRGLGHSTRVYKGKLISATERRFWRVA